MNSILQKSFLFFFLLCSILNNSSSFSQELTKEDNNLLFSDLAQNQIIALGDATHSDYTASKFRVDLMKELVENYNFTIIGIESNLYEVYKAFEDFKKNADIVAMNSSIYTIVRNNHLDELFFYLKEQNEKGNNIKVFGFDASLSGGNAYETFMQGIESNLNNTEIECGDISLQTFSKRFKNLTPTNLKALLRTKKDYNVVYDYLGCYLNQDTTGDDNEVLNRALANLHATIEGKQAGKMNHYTRDSLMFNNIVYLKNKYPKEKMILFGSTSHFIKSPKTINSKYMPSQEWVSLGERLHKAFPKDYFFIAYTGVSGNTRGFYGKKVKLGKLLPNSIENTVNEKYDSSNQIMYLSVNRDKSILDKADSSRILGNTFQEMDISSNVDGLFLIRDSNMD
ncbi:erythromycin esterase family protein [Myroides guanonis]|uniref:Erythromycin esterase homolog n=1 Tax=Myroides guanonis TaxID=1150112 RepID=A0A1I3U5H6_9FLAO|nr:erythromycin esterase family protein [Myroides guanonis]SFJ77829.1 Erythromycin esterase homolog [Myroides guanonis]